MGRGDRAVGPAGCEGGTMPWSVCKKTMIYVQEKEMDLEDVQRTRSKEGRRHQNCRRLMEKDRIFVEPYNNLNYTYPPPLFFKLNTYILHTIVILYIYFLFSSLYNVICI